ncbi:MAG: hypothetical protein OSJ83_01570 [Clostridia bacterium]|nr:hypothetical protein [Clostridia bacterium]
MECNKPVEINIPDPLPDFNADSNIGTWKQLFAENIGKRAKIEISLFDGTLRGITGEIYIVGNTYVGVTCNGNVCLCDIYSVKFVTFF